MHRDLDDRPMFGLDREVDYSSFEWHADVFSDVECDWIIDYGATLPHDEAEIETDRGPEDADTTAGLRRSTIAWVPPDADVWWVYERLGQVAAEANERYGFDLSGFGEDLQFTTYDAPGAFYEWHVDGLAGGVSGRKLSMVVQLTDPDDYDGGALEFLEIVEDATPEEYAEHVARTSKRGTVVVFPAFEWHRIRPVTSGRRRSLVAWVSGPPFR